MSEWDSRQQSTTVDPLPRTVLAWQRTLLVLASFAIGLSFTLSLRGHGLWAVPVLAATALVVPIVIQRQRELLQPAPPVVTAARLAPVTALVGVLFLTCLAAAVFIEPSG